MSITPPPRLGLTRNLTASWVIGRGNFAASIAYPHGPSRPAPIVRFTFVQPAPHDSNRPASLELHKIPKFMKKP